MAKFNFRLAPILRIKEKVEDLKKNEFGKAIVELEGERTRLAALEGDRTACIQSFRASLNKGVAPDEIRQHNIYLDKLKVLIKQQHIVIARAEEKVEQKRKELVEAMRDRKALDVLKENERLEFLEEEKRSEQKSVDEIVSYKVASKVTKV